MSVPFDSRVYPTNANDSLELTKVHGSNSTKWPAFKQDYHLKAQASLSSNEPGAAKSSSQDHSTERVVETRHRVESSVDNMCEQSSGSKHGGSQYSKKSNERAQGQESRDLAETRSSMPCVAFGGIAPPVGTLQPGADLSKSVPSPETAFNLHVFEAPSSVTVNAGKDPCLPLITPNDYTDRQRLLYHITYLHTQLQRAFFQIQQQHRIITILQASANVVGIEKSNQGRSRKSAKTIEDTNLGIQDPERDASESVVVLRISASCTAGAVAASETEEELNTSLRRSLALFDPAIAQSQIQRLDDALAHLSILREAELQQLQRGEEELKELRKTRNELVHRVNVLQSTHEQLRTENEELHASLSSASMEVERLRQEELRLSRRIVSIEGLLQSGSLYDGVSVVDAQGRYQPRQTMESNTSSASATKTKVRNPVLDINLQALDKLKEEETVMRQALLQDFFWEPMLIAFDAGLTWTEEYLALHEQRNASVVNSSSHACGSNLRKELSQATQTEDNAAINELAAAMQAPVTDTDLLLLRSQRDEIHQLQKRVAVLRDQQRLSSIEIDRLNNLYANEQRRTEGLARAHHEQLQEAYQELVRDRQIIVEQLREEVEKQVRNAFEDGRRFERQQREGSLSTKFNPSDSLCHAEKTQGGPHLIGSPALTSI